MSLVRRFLLVFIGVSLCMNAALARHQVVLVASADSPVHELSSLQVRKIFLGFNVKYDGKFIKGLRNTADSDLNKIFLQNVVAMSEKAYARRQLSLTLRQGIPRVSEYTDIEKLLKVLSKNPYGISYMWDEDAVDNPDLKVIRVLWGQE